MKVTYFKGLRWYRFASTDFINTYILVFSRELLLLLARCSGGHRRARELFVFARVHSIVLCVELMIITRFLHFVFGCRWLLNIRLMKGAKNLLINLLAGIWWSICYTENNENNKSQVTYFISTSKRSIIHKLELVALNGFFICLFFIFHHSFTSSISEAEPNWMRNWSLLLFLLLKTLPPRLSRNTIMFFPQNRHSNLKNNINYKWSWARLRARSLYRNKRQEYNNVFRKIRKKNIDHCLLFCRL